MFTKWTKCWDLYTLRHGIQTLTEAILVCNPAPSTQWLDWVTKWCELWRICTGPFAQGVLPNDVIGANETLDVACAGHTDTFHDRNHRLWKQLFFLFTHFWQGSTSAYWPSAIRYCAWKSVTGAGVCQTRTKVACLCCHVSFLPLLSFFFHLLPQVVQEMISISSPPKPEKYACLQLVIRVSLGFLGDRALSAMSDHESKDLTCFEVLTFWQRQNAEEWRTGL